MSSEPKAAAWRIFNDADACVTLDQLEAEQDKLAGWQVEPLYDEQALSALRAEVEALRSDMEAYMATANAEANEAEPLRKDAERYRWLRNEAWRHPVTAPAVAVFDADGQLVELDCEGFELDEAIDAAMENPA